MAYIPPNPKYAPPNAGNNNSTGAIPVYVVSGVVSGGITPRAGLVSQITTGQTAVTVVTGPINGGFIGNPPNAASQGIAGAENIYVDFVGTPGYTDAAANGTTSLIPPGGSVTLLSLATGVSVRVNAATSGHKFTVNVW